MTRKELQKQQYSQLRAAGFSANVARRFRGSSQQKIEDIIKRGTGAELPEKSIKMQRAAIIGNIKRGYKVKTIPFSTDLPKRYLAKYTWIVRFTLQNYVTKEVKEGFVTVTNTKQLSDVAVLTQAEQIIKTGVANNDSYYTLEGYILTSIIIIEKYYNRKGV